MDDFYTAGNGLFSDFSAFVNISTLRFSNILQMYTEMLGRLQRLLLHGGSMHLVKIQPLVHILVQGADPVSYTHLTLPTTSRV